MPRYRVGKEGVRIINPDGGGYHLPPGVVLDELPDRYEGSVELVEWDGPKRVEGHETAVIRPGEVK